MTPKQALKNSSAHTTHSWCCYRCKTAFHDKEEVPQDRGVHPSEGMMHFPPVSYFPLFPNKFSDSVKNLPNFTFSDQIFPFSFTKIFLMTLFSHWPQNFEFPLFSLIFPTFPLFREIPHSILFKISLWFRIIYVLFTYFMCFSFPPYFDHDAFMHHTMHVLDASGRKHRFRQAQRRIV